VPRIASEPVRAARVAAVVVALVAACGDPSPDPGEVARQEEVDIGGVRAVRIRYGSIDVEGDGSTVGGLVVVPAGEPPAEGWPIVAYAHGTTGSADDCAPSEDPTLASVDAALRSLAGAGFVAVATDYEGIGTSGPHPYLNGRSEARALADAARAARRVVPDAGTRWAVLGYSQGGHAAMWAAEVAADDAPELQLVGAAAQAPVTDPAQLVHGGLGITALLVAGWVASSPDLDDDEALTEAGRRAVEDAEDVCTVEVDDPNLVVDTAGFEAYLADNVVGQRPATVPVLVLQGTSDPLTHPDTTEQAVERSCAAGTTVELRTYDGADHLTVVERSTPDALAWLAERFAGAPPTSTCAV
jgi:alpha-beta hydrolase superfamily lysophospholipase